MNYCILISGLFLTLLSCSTTNLESSSGDESIIGQWQNTEAYISAGAEQYWQDVSDGEIISFQTDNQFISDKYAECSMGTFEQLEDRLSLKYSCPNFDPLAADSTGTIVYSIDFSVEEFIVTPLTGPLCIEGCSYKYVRIKN